MVPVTRPPKSSQKVCKIHAGLREGRTSVKIRKEVEVTFGQQQDRDKASLKHRAKNKDSEELGSRSQGEL